MSLPPPESIDSIPHAELPAALAHLLALQARAVARMAIAQPADGDRLLDAIEAGEMLAKSPKWLYKHSRHLPFARRVGRSLRFSEAGIRRYIDRSRP